MIDFIFIKDTITGKSFQIVTIDECTAVSIDGETKEIKEYSIGKAIRTWMKEVKSAND